MPIDQYSELLGGDANEIMRQLVKQYGPRKGREVFYALVEKAKKGKPRKKAKKGALRKQMARKQAASDADAPVGPSY